MNTLKKTIVATASAIGLSAGILLGGATAAQAATADTYDCFPASNTIMSSAGCSDGNHYHASGPGAIGNGRIVWENDAGIIQVHGIVTDTAKDGKGAIMRVRWYNGNTGGSAYRTFHNTTGYNTTLEQNQSFKTAGRNLNSKDEITVWMCNGVSSTGVLLNCSDAHHGPFHNY